MIGHHTRNQPLQHTGCCPSRDEALASSAMDRKSLYGGGSFAPAKLTHHYFFCLPDNFRLSLFKLFIKTPATLQKSLKSASGMASKNYRSSASRCFKPSIRSATFRGNFRLQLVDERVVAITALQHCARRQGGCKKGPLHCQC